MEGILYVRGGLGRSVEVSLTNSKISHIYGEVRRASVTLEEPKGEGQKCRMLWEQVLLSSSGSWKFTFQEHVSFRCLKDGERELIRGDTHKTK